jgi:hypothetical protein
MIAVKAVATGLQHLLGEERRADTGRLGVLAELAVQLGDDAPGRTA